MTRSSACRAAFAALALLASVPFLSSAIDIGPGWHPVGDTAIVATRARDVFTADTPLLGQPSTAGDRVGKQVHHPGPLEFWVIAAGQRVKDDPRVSLVLTTVINAAAAVTVLFWVSRIGGVRSAALASPFLLAMLWSLRGHVLVDPLNSFAAVLPFSAYLLALVAAGSGQRWALTSAVLFGSYAAQAHLTITGLVGGAALATIAVIVMRCWRRTGSDREITPDRRRRAAVALVALALCWAGPAIEAARHRGGNLVALLSTGQALQENTIGLARAMDISTRAIGARPAWAHAGVDGPALMAEPTALQRWSAVAVLGVGLVASAASRRRVPAIGGAFAVAATVLVVGTALTARIPNEFFNMTALGNFLWLWPAGALLWATAAFGIGDLLIRTAPRAVPNAAPLIGAALASVLALACVVAPGHRPGATELPVYTRSLASQLAQRLDPDVVYTIDIDRPLYASAISLGVFHELTRQGFDLRVNGFDASFGRRRSRGHEGTGGTLVLQRGRSSAPPPAPPAPGAELVAQWVPSAESLDRLRRAEADLAERIEREGGTAAVIPALPGLPDHTVSPADLARGEFVALVDGGLAVRGAGAWEETRALAEVHATPVDHVTIHMVPTPAR